MKRFFLFFLVIFTIPIFYCQKLQGEFAFKQSEDKAYKLLYNKLEFSASEEVDWIYKFNFIVSKRLDISVIILKKEIGWIDILTVSDYIDPSKNIIYGKLKDFEPGDYKIVLVQTVSGKNKIIDEVEIYLYSDEDVLD
jgi:hypothetical protein